MTGVQTCALPICTNDAYEAVLTGSDIKNAQAGVDDSGTVKDYVVH